MRAGFSEGSVAIDEDGRGDLVIARDESDGGRFPWPGDGRAGAIDVDWGSDSNRRRSRSAVARGEDKDS